MGNDVEVRGKGLSTVLTVPQWLVQSIAWIALLGALGWGTYLQARSDQLKDDLSTTQTRVSVAESQFKDIVKSLDRIESKLDNLESKDGNHN